MPQFELAPIQSPEQSTGQITSKLTQKEWDNFLEENKTFIALVDEERSKGNLTTGKQRKLRIEFKIDFCCQIDTYRDFECGEYNGEVNKYSGKAFGEGTKIYPHSTITGTWQNNRSHGYCKLITL